MSLSVPWIHTITGSALKMSVYKKEYTLSNNWSILRSEITSSLDLHTEEGVSYTSIPFAPSNLVNKAKSDGSYIHWGQIVIEVVALHKHKGNECLLLLHDDRFIDPQKRLISARNFMIDKKSTTITFEPDFLVSLDDQTAMDSLRLSLFVRDLEMVPGAKPIAVKSSGLYKVIKNLTEDLGYRQRNFEIPEGTEDYAELIKTFPKHAFEIEEDIVSHWSVIKGKKRTHKANIKRAVTLPPGPDARQLRYLQRVNSVNSFKRENIERHLEDQAQASTPSSSNNDNLSTKDLATERRGDNIKYGKDRSVSEIAEARRAKGCTGQFEGCGENSFRKHSDVWDLRGNSVSGNNSSGGGL